MSFTIFHHKYAPHCLLILGKNSFFSLIQELSGNYDFLLEINLLLKELIKDNTTNLLNNRNKF